MQPNFIISARKDQVTHGSFSNARLGHVTHLSVTSPFQALKVMIHLFKITFIFVSVVYNTKQ